MQLSIDSLREAGAFTGAPVEKEITWKDHKGREHTHTVFVRPLSYHSMKSDLLSLHGQSDATAGRIAACIVSEGGDPVFTEADVTGVNPDGSPVMWLNPDTGKDEPRGAMIDSLSTALLAVIGEVNGMGKQKS